MTHQWDWHLPQLKADWTPESTLAHHSPIQSVRLANEKVGPFSWISAPFILPTLKRSYNHPSKGLPHCLNKAAHRRTFIFSSKIVLCLKMQHCLVIGSQEHNSEEPPREPCCQDHTVTEPGLSPSKNHQPASCEENARWNGRHPVFMTITL